MNTSKLLIVCCYICYIKFFLKKSEQIIDVYIEKNYVVKNL